LNEEGRNYRTERLRLEEINNQIGYLDQRINFKSAQLRVPSRSNSHTVNGQLEADVRSLRAEKERLIAERGSEGPPGASSGLLRHLAWYRQYFPQLVEIHAEWEAIVHGWDELLKSVKTLENNWESQSTQRQREEEKKQDAGKKLRRIAAKAMVGMIGCWVAQWVWWVGYIRLAGDSYVDLFVFPHPDANAIAQS
jgi:hypothetical protein